MSEQNGFITREAALQRKPRRFAEIEIEGWGKFRIRSLTERERSAQFEASIRGANGQVVHRKLGDLKCQLIVLTVVDADGNLLFTNNDIPELREQDSALTNTLVDFIHKHCRINATDLEELEKNSAATSAAS